MTGEVITIEGGDRVGKHTQSLLLTEYLKNMGIDARQYSFPNYGSIQAMPVEKYLAGSFLDISPMEAAMLYAFDRSITIREEKILEFVDNGGWVVFDRYTPSNMMYQAARTVANVDQDLSKPIYYNKGIINDISQLEYGMLGIPKPTTIFYLNLDRSLNDILLQKDLGKDGGDIHEKNHTLLDKAANIGLQLAEERGWNIIECGNDDNTAILKPEVIHAKIAAIADELIANSKG